jgi:hypothetical protein
VQQQPDRLLRTDRRVKTMNAATVESRPDAEAPARVLALFVAANGSIDDDEIDMLERLDAFRRLDVSRRRFIEMAQRCIDEVGSGLCERSWLCVADLDYVNALLDAVADTSMRLLVCRLSVAAITADGRISRDERMVYDHALARWRILPQQVSEAIRRDSASS